MSPVLNYKGRVQVFEVGDIVCYPMHGVGSVQGIDENTVLGETNSYYIICFVSTNLKAMVPVSSAEQIGLRRIIASEECEKVLRYFETFEPGEMSDNWNQRYRENLKKLKSGNIYDMVDVVKGLRSRSETRGLSSGERKMFLTARQVLITELSVASGMDAEEISKVI